MNNIAVIFSSSGVRILHGINIDDYKNNPNVLINPVFPKGIPPHLWQKVGNEIKVIDQDIQQDIKNEITRVNSFFTKREKIMFSIIIFALSAGVIFLLSKAGF